MLIASGAKGNHRKPDGCVFSEPAKQGHEIAFADGATVHDLHDISPEIAVDSQPFG